MTILEPKNPIYPWGIAFPHSKFAIPDADFQLARGHLQSDGHGATEGSGREERFGSLFSRSVFILKSVVRFFYLPFSTVAALRLCTRPHRQQRMKKIIAQRGEGAKEENSIPERIHDRHACVDLPVIGNPIAFANRESGPKHRLGDRQHRIASKRAEDFGHLFLRQLEFADRIDKNSANT